MVLYAKPEQMRRDKPPPKRRDGNAFIGLSLSQKSHLGHENTVTHQSAFDLNEVIDREYEYVQSCDDDGWLVGGGEPGFPTSFKIPAKDTAHVELMRIGTFRPDWGGVTEEEIIRVLYSGKILIPQIDVLPTSVAADGDNPDILLRFDMDPPIPDFSNPRAPLPINWSIRFVQNQLFEHFRFPSRHCPDPFHLKLAKRVEFRSPTHKTFYLGKCYNAIKEWRKQGPQPLNNGGWDIDGTPIAGFINGPDSQFHSGIWLFENRHTITHFFPPNFLPPYNTREKRKLILDCLRQEWDDKTEQWRPVGFRLYEQMQDTKNILSKETKLTRQVEYESCPPLCAAFEGCMPS